MIKFHCISDSLYETDALSPAQRDIYIRMLKDAVYSDEYDFRGVKLKRGQLLLTKSKMQEYQSFNTVMGALRRLEELGEITTEKLKGRYNFGNGTLITFVYYDECIISPQSPSKLTSSRKIIGSKTDPIIRSKTDPIIGSKTDPGTESNREYNQQPNSGGGGVPPSPEAALRAWIDTKLAMYEDVYRSTDQVLAYHEVLDIKEHLGDLGFFDCFERERNCCLEILHSYDPHHKRRCDMHTCTEENPNFDKMLKKFAY